MQIADLSPNPSSAIVLYESTILLYHISQNIVHLSASIAVKKSSFSLIVHIILSSKEKTPIGSSIAAYFLIENSLKTAACCIPLDAHDPPPLKDAKANVEPSRSTSLTPFDTPPGKLSVCCSIHLFPVDRLFMGRMVLPHGF